VKSTGSDRFIFGWTVRSLAAVVIKNVFGVSFMLHRSKQEAPLPQRNSASAAHMYLGWLAYLLMITHSRLVVQ